MLLLGQVELVVAVVEARELIVEKLIRFNINARFNVETIFISFLGDGSLM